MVYDDLSGSAPQAVRQVFPFVSVAAEELLLRSYWVKTYVLLAVQSVLPGA